MKAAVFNHRLLERLRKANKKQTFEVTEELKASQKYNISPTTLWRFETGKSSPQVKDLKVLARYYKVDIGVFFEKN